MPVEEAERILIADEDGRSAADLERALRGEGLVADTCETATAALARLEARPHAVLLCSVGLPDASGLELLRRARSLPVPPAVILASAFATAQEALAARRAGAFEYLTKPLLAGEVVLVVRRALEERNLRDENRNLKARLGLEDTLDRMVARDPSMRRTFEVARRVACTRATVLISGESGTGKTLMARAIHRLSDRADRPFVVVSCGSLPENLLETELFGHARGAYTGAHRDAVGRFEQADGGTLFLDEIGAASPALQLKLLRFLQDRQFERVGETRTRTADVRLLLATNQDLATAVRRGAFREDLFYRIQVIHLHLPPLRQRSADIVPLARRLLEGIAASHARLVPRLSRAAARCLLEYSWPGNVRELENALERALLLCRDGVIQPADLPDEVRGAVPDPVAGGNGLPRLERGRRYSLKKLLEEPERRILLAALAACDGNREAAARMLGINRATLYAKMRRLGIRGRVPPPATS